MKIGDRRGHLVLLKTFPDLLSSAQKGLFRCDCGTEIERYITSVMKESRQPKSCGCKKKVEVPRAIKKKGFDGYMANLFLMGKL